VQVVLEQSGEGGLPVGIGVLLGGQPRGVRAHEVVEPVAPHDDLSEQVGVDEVLEEPLGCIQAGAGEGRCGVQVKVRARVQPEQSEQPAVLVIHFAVGRRESRRDASVAVGQLAQPGVFAGEPLGQLSGSPHRAVAKPGGGDPEGERQASAQLDDLLDRAVVAGDPVLSRDLAEQGGRIGWR